MNDPRKTERRAIPAERKDVLHMDHYTPSPDRYDKIPYNRSGKSGLKLPAFSLGLWHNFGEGDDYDNMRAMIRCAFDNGITLFDLANNYGPPYGSAEKSFGKLFAEDLKPYRDELLIATKAGYDMWPGPYGNWGSRKYLFASLDQSLLRMGLDYVDIFYHHRMDPDTPLEETMNALADLTVQGKALYIGISRYSVPRLEEALKILRERRCPVVLFQDRYSLFDRHIETEGIKTCCREQGLGITSFSPLAQGLLSDKYLQGIPEDSRMKKDGRYLHESDLTPAKLQAIRQLNELAKERGQSLAEMALAWILRDGGVASVLIGASRPAQILENVKAADNTKFSEEELKKIDSITDI